MMRTYEMIDKGYEYRTEGYILRKGWNKQKTTNVGFATLERYSLVQHWAVYPDTENVIYQFHTLKEAKKFIAERDAQ